MKKLIAVTIITLSVFLAQGCGLWDEPDFRNVKWGMSKRDVKAKETAELVKEGDDVLTYRITGDMIDMSGPVKESDEDNKESTDGDEQEGEAPVVTPIHYEYDLIYVFGEDKLGMAVIHLRESLKEPVNYIEIFKNKSRHVSDIIGAPAQGVAEYPTGEVSRSDPYETPEDICAGKYVLKHIWPAKNSTNVSLELDKKSFSSEPDCNLSIFYESSDVDIDPVLRDQLHEVL